jgi:membrane protein DedA with SNARE-associated domain
VEQFLHDLLTSSSGFASYLLVFGVLLACGLGVPLPEDISLILGGFLAYQGSVNLTVMMVVGFVGILCGDSLIYLAGRRVGTRVGRKGAVGFLARIVTPEKRAKVESLFAAHGQKIVMIARFLPGVRAVTYFTAGSAGMSYWRFIFWDGIAALASAPVFVYLGYRFGGELKQLYHAVKNGQIVVVGTLVVAALGYLIFRLRKNAALKREMAAQKGSPPTSVPADGSQAAGRLQVGK